MRRALLAVAALVLAAGGVVGGPSPATAADPMRGAPEVGACYDLTLKQVWAESTGKPTIDCSRKHTVLVGAVGTIPDGVRWKDVEMTYEAVEGICGPFWNRQLGRSHPVRYATLLAPFWLMPTPAQREQGARWVSCLVAMRAGDRLVAMPKGELPRVTREPASSIARCLDRKLAYVPCSEPHIARATHTFAVRATGGDRARQATVERAAKRVCSRRVTSRRYTWSAERRSSTKPWYAVACYSVTTR